MHVDMHSQRSARYWICYVTCSSDRLLRILIFGRIIIVLEKVTAHNACRHTFSTVYSRLNSLGTCSQCTLFWIFNMFEVSVTHNSNRRIFLTFSLLLNSHAKNSSLLRILNILEEFVMHITYRHIFILFSSLLNSIPKSSLLRIVNILEEFVTQNTGKHVFILFSLLLNSQWKIAVFWEFSIFGKNSSRTIEVDVYSYYSARYCIRNAKYLEHGPLRISPVFEEVVIYNMAWHTLSIWDGYDY